jgi:hypothetical protein
MHRTGRTRKTTSTAVLHPVAVADAAPKRGVKLKHVSTFIMLVAVLCLFAYLAGRVDVSAATSTPAPVQNAEHFTGVQDGERHKGVRHVLGIANCQI